MINTTGIASRSLQNLVDDGAKTEPAKDFRGRVAALDEKAFKAAVANHETTTAQLKTIGEDWRRVAEAEVMEPREKAQIHAVRNKVPSLNRAKSETIANALAADHEDMANAVAAAKAGTYVRVLHKDGTVEQGVMKPSASEGPQREGLWVHTKDGKVIQTAEFKDGKLDGDSRFYDEKKDMVKSGFYREGKPAGTHREYRDGEVVHRTMYDENGQVARDEAVDPAAAKAQKARYALQRGIQIG